MLAQRNVETEFHKRFDAGVWRKVFRLLHPYRGRYLLLVCVIGLLAGVEVSFPLVVRYAIDRGITPCNTGQLCIATAEYLGLIILQTALVCAFIAGCGRIGTRVMSDLRRRTFHHLQELSISYFDRTPVGWIMSRILSDSQRIGETITWGAVDFAWGIIMMVLIAGAMLVVHWQLGCTVLVLLPVILLISVRFQKWILQMYRRIRRLNSEITAGFNEGLTGLRVIKSLCRESPVIGEFEELTGNMYRASFHSALLSSIYLPVVHVIGALGSAMVLGLGGGGVIAGSISLGTLVAFVSYTRRFFDPANEIARVFGQLQETQASAERLFSLLETRPEVTNRIDARPAGELADRVAFLNVSFSYCGRHHVLENFSLEVQPGETIALVGPTGGGKTTIVNLLMRFHDPDSGSVRIGGTDIRDFTIQSLRSRMGIVLQAPYLFSGSIRENIRYGNLEASDEAIMKAAGRVGAHGFIMAFPEGYDTRIRENGEPLSTGQKQLVSFARAVLADPVIFIMDEATSSVDTETEYQIQTAMETLLRGRTSFIIAHRLTTIRRADRIVVIEKGRIAECGTHLALLRLRGQYARLVHQQFADAPATG
ncbi:ABC transporter ATP-binding protein [bacterium]|nr:ABC transporter ATP-binding protein [candidate division CSSED10-310 bacterium]